MNEFPNYNQEENEEVVNTENNGFTEEQPNVESLEENFTEEEPFKEPIQDNYTEYSVPYNPINFTPVTHFEKSPNSKGLKVFALAMALVVLLTGSCLTGYFVGRGQNKGGTTSKVNVNLAAAPTDSDEMTVAQVYEKVSPSIVGISVYNTAGKGGNATGIVYSKDGYIVTNDHIYAEVANAKFKIHTADGNIYPAEYVAGDDVSDLAILKVKDVNFTPAVFGNSDEVFFGQNVAAIGNPNGAFEPSTITGGTVSAVDCRVTGSTNYSSRLIQTDSAINPGNSGGALVNMYGQVIGVTSSKLASDVYDNVGYAIPTTIMKRIVDELISDGKVVSRARLGVTYTEVNSVTAEINGYKQVGILIASVSEDSGLYGKVKEGDFITHINGMEIVTSKIVLDVIEQAKAGDTVTVTVVTADGTAKTVDAVLKANVGASSYTTEMENGSLPNGGNLPEGGLLPDDSSEPNGGSHW